jgi:hypothetical protein
LNFVIVQLKVIFIWSVRDKVTADAMQKDMLTPSHLPISFQPPLEVSPEVRTRTYSHGSQSAQLGDKVVTSLDPDEMDSQKIASPYVFFSEFYLTSLRNKEDFANANIDPVAQKHLKFGRPNVGQIFADTTQLCEANSIGRVAVAVCGPPDLVSDVVDRCRVSQMQFGCSKVRFDCQDEVFNF